MSTAQANLFEKARWFFAGMASSANLQDYMHDADHIVQFCPTDGEAFHVRISAGSVNLEKGRKYHEETAGALYITGNEKSLDALFSGDISVAEAIYHQNIQIAGYRNKEPLLVAFSKLLRMGVWDLVKGSRLLMPTK